MSKNKRCWELQDKLCVFDKQMNSHAAAAFLKHAGSQGSRGAVEVLHYQQDVEGDDESGARPRRHRHRRRSGEFSHHLSSSRRRSNPAPTPAPTPIPPPGFPRWTAPQPDPHKPLGGYPKLTQLSKVEVLHGGKLPLPGSDAGPIGSYNHNVKPHCP